MTFEPGVTILTGRNANNRTSFLRAIMAALGSDKATLKGDANEGRVELTLDDETFTRTFKRQGDSVVASGGPFLEEPTLAYLFALESNEARRAVASGQDSRLFIMGPVDTAEIDRLVERREEIDDLRTKIDRIEREAGEEFNNHVDTVLTLLDYDNLGRIWLERVETEVREGRLTVERTRFELHVVRSTASGGTYEDTVDHLSKSEREVTGLVFALADYLAHDVHEDLPFVLVDSVEAFDSERLARLVDYLSDHAGYLVAALLPEDASELYEEYERVTENLGGEQ